MKSKRRSLNWDPDNDIVGFTCGAMDLFHAGHLLMLKEASEHCDYLIVGLHTNPTIDRPDKNMPIQSLEEREIQLEGCVYVNEIMKYETESDLHFIIETLSEKWNDRFVRFIGMDWKGKPYTGHELPIKMHFNSRDHNYSSSELRSRIYKAEFEKRFKPVEELL